MMLRITILVQVLTVADAQFYKFCEQGIKNPLLAEDGGQPSISVIVAQAPLFSTNHYIGKSAGLFGLFHTALVLEQGVNGTQQYWTLEFDIAGKSIVTGVVPQIISGPSGDKLFWDCDVRYCLTRGLLWGRKHWTKSFETVLHATKAQVELAFAAVVHPVNSSLHGMGFRYQPWLVARTKLLDRPNDILIKDITCTDGVNWFVHHLVMKLGILPKHDWILRGTSIVVRSNAVLPVNTENLWEWRDVVQYYKKFAELTNPKVSLLRKIEDVFKLLPIKYVYDANSGIYYKVLDNSFLWAHSEYYNVPLSGPPAIFANQINRTEATLIV